MKFVVKIPHPAYLKDFPKRDGTGGSYTDDLNYALKFDHWSEAQKALNLLMFPQGLEAYIINLDEAIIEDVLGS